MACSEQIQFSRISLYIHIPEWVFKKYLRCSHSIHAMPCEIFQQISLLLQEKGVRFPRFLATMKWLWYWQQLNCKCSSVSTGLEAKKSLYSLNFNRFVHLSFSYLIHWNPSIVEPSIVEKTSLIDKQGLTNRFSLHKNLSLVENPSIVDDLALTKKSIIEGFQCTIKTPPKKAFLQRPLYYI